MRKISLILLLLFTFSLLSGVSMPATKGAEVESSTVSEADVKSIDEGSMTNKIKKKDKSVKSEIRKLIKLQAKAVLSKNQKQNEKLNSKLAYITQGTEEKNGNKTFSNKILKEVASEIIAEAGGLEKVQKAVINSYNTGKQLTESELNAYLAMSLDYEVEFNNEVVGEEEYNKTKTLGEKVQKTYPTKCSNGYGQVKYSKIGSGYIYNTRTRACHNGLIVTEGQGIIDGATRFGLIGYTYVWEGNQMNTGNYSTDKKYYRHRYGGLLSQSLYGFPMYYYRPEIHTKFSYNGTIETVYSRAS